MDVQRNSRQRSCLVENDQLQQDQINLKKEYGNHLKIMHELQLFKELKLHWDHAYYKSIIMPSVDLHKQKMSRKSFVEAASDSVNLLEESEKLMMQDMNSIIDKKYQSYLTNEQEESIPRDPIRIAANKKLISTWYESKKQIETELYA